MSFVGHKKIKKQKFLLNQNVELLKLTPKEIQLENQNVYTKLSSEFVQSDQSEFVPLNEFVDSFFPRERKIAIALNEGDNKKKRKVVSIQQSDWTRNSWSRDTENSIKVRKKRRKSISSKEIKENKLFELPEEDRVYSKYIMLNQLWTQYILDLTSSCKVKNQFEMAPKLLRADLHGAIIKVIKSNQPSLVGIEGIILQETTKTFKIITPQNTLKVIPKIKTVFTLVVRGFLVTLHGLHFEKSSPIRSKDRFKNKDTMDF